MAIKKVYYNGSSKIIKAICNAINDIIDSGGGGGDTVTITPTLLSGNKIADYTINGVADELYIPDDGKDMTETFTSSDVADGSATSWTSVAKLDSGETHSSIFAKMSQMFKNVRFLYKTLGNTDLSAIGGTVTKSLSNAYAIEAVTVTKTNISSGTVSVTMIGKRLLLVHMSGIVPTNVSNPIKVTIPSSISIDTAKTPTLEYMAYSGFYPSSELHSVLSLSAFTAHSWQLQLSSSYPYCYVYGVLPVIA